MNKIELSYAEIEKLQHVIRNYMQDVSTLTPQEKDQLEALAYKLIAMRAQLEYLRTRTEE